MTFLNHLEPEEYDTRKSFYKKAKVFYDPATDDQVLVSYSTEVARLHADDTVTVNGWYSQTTARHINEFLVQNGFPALSKKQMENEALFPMNTKGEPARNAQKSDAPANRSTDTTKQGENNYNYLFGYTDMI